MDECWLFRWRFSHDGAAPALVAPSLELLRGARRRKK
jgi:hypothetical protein